MNIVGYSDPLSIAPGERLRLMASTRLIVVRGLGRTHRRRRRPCRYRDSHRRELPRARPEAPARLVRRRRRPAATRSRRGFHPGSVGLADRARRAPASSRRAARRRTGLRPRHRRPRPGGPLARRRGHRHRRAATAPLVVPRRSVLRRGVRLGEDHAGASRRVARRRRDPDRRTERRRVGRACGPVPPGRLGRARLRALQRKDRGA